MTKRSTYKLLALITTAFFVFACSKKVVWVEPGSVQPTGIAVNYTELHIEQGGTSSALKVIPTPLNASVDDLVWTSNDTNLTISGTGSDRTLVVSANAVPSTKYQVTIASKDGKVKATADVLVVDKKIATTSIKLVNYDNPANNRVDIPNNSNYAPLLKIEPKTSTDREVEYTLEAIGNEAKNTKFDVNKSTGYVSTGNASGGSKMKLVATLLSSKTSDTPIRSELILTPVVTKMPNEILASSQKVKFIYGKDTEQTQKVFIVARPSLDVNKNNLRTTATTMGTIAGTNKDGNTMIDASLTGQVLTITAGANTIKTDEPNGHVEVYLNSNNTVKTKIAIEFTEETIPLTQIGINEKPFDDADINKRKNLILNPGPYNLDESAGEFNFTVAFTPDNASNKNIVWSSSDEEIAKVVDGYVKAGTKAGVVTIKAISLANPSLFVERKIEVINGVKLESVSAPEVVGDKENKFNLFDASDSSQIRKTIEVKLTPANASNKHISWTAMDPNSLKIIDVKTTNDGYSKVTVEFVGEGGEAPLVGISQDGRKFTSINIKSANKLLQKVEIVGKSGLTGNIGANEYLNDFNNLQSFEVSKSEMIFSYWKEVFTFATTPSEADATKRKADGGELYEFMSTGTLGNQSPTASLSLPVAGLNYVDAVAFANATTEYMNFKNGLTPANASDPKYIQPYYQIAENSVNKIFRKSTIEVRDEFNNSTGNLFSATPNSTGFRLLTQAEWLLVASLTDVTDAGLIHSSKTVTLKAADGNNKAYNILKPEFVSGQKSAADDKSLYGIFKESVTSTNADVAKVCSKKPNALGICDMSGNLAEYVFVNSDVTKIPVLGGDFKTLKTNANIKTSVNETAQGVDMARRLYGLRLARTLK